VTDPSDTECFSQIIGFQENHQETLINEFENFIHKQFKKVQQLDKDNGDSSSDAEQEAIFKVEPEKPKKKRKKRQAAEVLKPIQTKPGTISSFGVT
jgi:hypothetical protein